MKGFWQDFKEWASNPFSEDMPMSHWFLLIGMVLIFVVIWNIILYHLLNALGDLTEG